MLFILCTCQETFFEACILSVTKHTNTHNHMYMYVDAYIDTHSVCMHAHAHTLPSMKEWTHFDWCLLWTHETGMDGCILLCSYINVKDKMSEILPRHIWQQARDIKLYSDLLKFNRGNLQYSGLLTGDLNFCICCRFLCSRNSQHFSFCHRHQNLQYQSLHFLACEKNKKQNCFISKMK